MKYRLWLLPLGCVLGYLLAINLVRFDGRVITEGWDNSGTQHIILRELQARAASLSGVLNVDQKLYRCEYYNRAGWPMFSCLTYYWDSYETKAASIDWTSWNSATVTLKGGPTFTLEGGEWHTTVHLRQ